MYQHKLSKVVHLEGEPDSGLFKCGITASHEHEPVARLCSSRRASVSDAKRPSERARVFLGKTTMPEFREAEIQPQLFA